jgi:peptidyl-prolyl cis-trans isomerase A (cyclophilin A)
MMLRVFIYTLILFITLSCESSADKKTQNLKKETNVKPEKRAVVVAKRKVDPITNKTVEERLLAYGKKNPETEVLIYTSKGKIKIKLFKDTPLHRANFIMLCKKGYFKGSVFTRVVKGFMAQAGGTYNEDHKMIKKNIGHYTIPSEFMKHHFHKKGAIGAARLYINNEEKRSVPYAFYFVEGLKYSKKSLKHYQEENEYTYSDKQWEYYKNNIGAAHIDGEHTVFGEIIEGYSIVPKLTDVNTDTRDWPLTDLFIDSVIVR